MAVWQTDRRTDGQTAGHNYDSNNVRLKRRALKTVLSLSDFQQRMLSTLRHCIYVTLLTTEVKQLPVAIDVIFWVIIFLKKLEFTGILFVIRSSN